MNHFRAFSISCVDLNIACVTKVCPKLKYEGFVHVCQIWCNGCILANDIWQESYYHCYFTANKLSKFVTRDGNDEIYLRSYGSKS